VNYTHFYNANGGIANSIDFDNSFGFAVQGGVDIALAGRWGINVDVKKLWLDTDVSVDVPGLGALRSTVDIDPWIVGAGISYKF